VTITSLEGARIVSFLLSKNGGLAPVADIIADAPKRSRHPGPTFNEFAKHCLNQEEPPGGTASDWCLAPCPFLDDNLCTIYPVRPFGCRSFFSNHCVIPFGKFEYKVMRACQLRNPYNIGHGSRRIMDCYIVPHAPIEKKIFLKNNPYLPPEPCRVC